MYPEQDRFPNDRERDDYEGFDEDESQRPRTRYSPRSRSFESGREGDGGRSGEGRGSSWRGGDFDQERGERFGGGARRGSSREDRGRRESRESYGASSGRRDDEFGRGYGGRGNRDEDAFAPGGHGYFEDERSWREPERFEDRFGDRDRDSQSGRFGAGRYGEGSGYRGGRPYGETGRESGGSFGSRSSGSSFREGLGSGGYSGQDSPRPHGAVYYEESWTITGPHTGRGPKGYRRSDEQIVEEINQRLERHGEIDASEIEVTCQNGIVSLKGKVDDRRTKRLAEECAENVYGALDVMNNLEVDRGFFGKLFGGSEDKDDE